MDIRHIYAVYYSAVGNTKKVTEWIAKEIARSFDLPYETIDFTLPCAREKRYSFCAGDLVIFGTPVYAGRIPNKMLPYVQTLFDGNDALAVPVVTYGNRSVDCALLELCKELEAHNFHTVAAASVVCAHVMSEYMASGRPNEEDHEQIVMFADKLCRKLRELDRIPDPVVLPGITEVGPYYTPLKADGTPARFLKSKPKTDETRCVNCGICASSCPMGAISPEEVSSVPGTCIKCHSCVHKCPEHAKYFDDPDLLSHIEMLEKNFNRRIESDFYGV